MTRKRTGAAGLFEDYARDTEASARQHAETSEGADTATPRRRPAATSAQRGSATAGRGDAAPSGRPDADTTRRAGAGRSRRRAAATREPSDNPVAQLLDDPALRGLDEETLRRLLADARSRLGQRYARTSAHVRRDQIEWATAQARAVSSDVLGEGPQGHDLSRSIVIRVAIDYLREAMERGRADLGELVHDLLQHEIEEFPGLRKRGIRLPSGTP